MTNEESRERRLRNTAKRRGLRLDKSRARDPRAIGYGGYNLSSRTTGVVEHGSGYERDFGLTLNDVEAILCDASDFDVYFDGLDRDFRDTDKPALIYRGKVGGIKTWDLMDEHGNHAAIGGDRASLTYVAVEARRYCDGGRQIDRAPEQVPEA